MNLLRENFFTKTKKQRNKNLIIFFTFVIIFTALYVLSFYTNNLAVSMVAGVVSIIILVLYYYGAIFDKNKLLKLYKSIKIGITQDDVYTFEKYDDETEHDGVKLLRLICSFTDDGEVFNRTLYFLTALPHPELSFGQKIKVKTYQNIILHIED